MSFVPAVDPFTAREAPESCTVAPSTRSPRAGCRAALEPDPLEDGPGICQYDGIDRRIARAYHRRVATPKSEQLQIRVTPAQKAELKRLARRAGTDLSSYVLARALPPLQLRVAAILRALRNDDERRFALAELHDVLVELPPHQFREALADVRVEGLSPFLQNYVAAMVEQAASQKGVAPPAWTRGIPPLDHPHFAVPFPRLRPHLLRAAPVAFKRRNIFVDAAVGARV